MEHSFDITIAKKYGVHSAILLNNIQYWIQKNAANQVHFHDGTYWTYNSVKAFEKLFPYLTVDQIRHALKKLIDEGILITGNYNEKPFDRTVWYAITKTGYSILQICEVEEAITSEVISDFPESTSDESRMDLGSIPNGFWNNPEPIPNNKPNINTDINNKSGDKPQTDETTAKKHFIPPSVEDVRAYCNERGNNVDPEQFVDFYSCKGWMVGKNKMKDWKAAVRTWEKDRKGAQNKTYIVDPDADLLPY